MDPLSTTAGVIGLGKAARKVISTIGKTGEASEELDTFLLTFQDSKENWERLKALSLIYQNQGPNSSKLRASSSISINSLSIH